MQQIIYWTTISCSDRTFILMSTTKGICWLGWSREDLNKGKKWVSKHMQATSFVEDSSFPNLEVASNELVRYFNGEKVTFTGPLDLIGTDFQKRVWKEMERIQYGHTKTYKELAVAAGSPLAYRAVGMACNKNPVAILVPCHRVIGSSGKLTGYAGGLSTKNLLLTLEGSI